MPLTQSQFEHVLTEIRQKLEIRAQSEGFQSAEQFELAVVAELQAHPLTAPLPIVHQVGSQNFPDIVVAESFGIEVKFKRGRRGASDGAWREIGNSIFEGSRLEGVEHVYVIFCRMGIASEVRVRPYSEAIYHVRTSHSPRFALSMESLDASLFGRPDGIGVTYEEFRSMPDRRKMELIKAYARAKHPGDWLWWVDDEVGAANDGELVIRNYLHLNAEERRSLIAEALLLVPECLSGGQGGNGRRKTKHYQRIGTYWLRAHSVYCGNVRDALTAGSVVDPCPDGVRMRCLVRHTLPFFASAITELSSGALIEFWGHDVPVEDRLDFWLSLADRYAVDWVPSAEASVGFDWSLIRTKIVG